MAIGLTVGLGACSIADMQRYNVPFRVALKGIVRDTGLALASASVALYDPFEARVAATGPPDRADLNLSGYRRVEQLLPVNRPVQILSNASLTLTEFDGQTIRKGPLPFAYQPYDEPRLHELRRRYKLDSVVAGATSDFEQLVLLRNWSRSQFRRSDYQPLARNFDALDILSRNHRNDNREAFSPSRHFDPCVSISNAVHPSGTQHGSSRTADVSEPRAGRGVVQPLSQVVCCRRRTEPSFRKGWAPAELHGGARGKQRAQADARPYCPRPTELRGSKHHHGAFTGTRIEGGKHPSLVRSTRRIWPTYGMTG